MIVELLHNTAVRFPKGAIVEVDETEAKRLIAFNNAKEVTTEPKRKPQRKGRRNNRPIFFRGQAWLLQLY